MEKAIQIRPNDNVAIARTKLESGESVLGIEAIQAIDPLHKIALTKIPSGTPVIRYGEPIGLASQDIKPGEWVHTHNLSFKYTGRDYKFATKNPPLPTPPTDLTHFQGFRRANGEAGTRNYIAVISSVNCSGHVPGLVVEKFKEIKKQFPNVDGILPFTHQTGCGITMGNEAHQTLHQTFAGMTKHPNIISYIMVGLGCEQLNPTGMVESGLVQLRDLTSQGQNGKPFPNKDDGSLLISIQSHGGTAKVVSEVCSYIEKLLPRANAAKRTSIPVEELILAMNCGGSDAFSGLTANPAVGYAADLLAALGGTAVLAETPETAGAEHILTERAINQEVGQKLVDLIRWWENYFAVHTFLHPQPSMDNNPSHGNKAGGLTTIVEKSLGAVAKGGTSRLNHVLKYAEKIPSRAGLCFMDTPGKDSSSMTGLVAGGSSIGVFTTGRGNVAGWAPVPTIKICTNTPTYQRLEGDMDLNAGGIMDGTASVEDVGLTILAKMVEVASGEQTCSERLGANTSCFDPWYFGPSV